MIQPDAIAAAILLPRAEEAWPPVLLGGLIPALGALGVYLLIRWAVKEPPEDQGPEDGLNAPPGPDGDGHEGPLS